MARKRNIADIQDFETTARTGPLIMRFFDEAEVVLMQAERTSAGSPAGWQLLVRLPTHLEGKFDVKRPIVAYEPNKVELELASAHALRALIRSAGGQVESDIGFLLTDDPDAEQKVGDWRSVLHDLRVVPLIADQEKLLSSTDVGLVLDDILAHWLFGRNFYDDRGPVVGDHFFGRGREIAKLTDRALEGRHSGVFGLRKIGKTSLLYAARDRLRSRANALSVFVDLQGAALGPPGADAAWHLGKGLATEIASTDLPISRADVEQALKLPALPTDVAPEQLVRAFCAGLGES